MNRIGLLLVLAALLGAGAAALMFSVREDKSAQPTAAVVKSEKSSCCAGH
ncbi:MAG: hypothetical protein ABDI19_04020 [Armatimonadota bacterium]